MINISSKTFGYFIFFIFVNLYANNALSSYFTVSTDKKVIFKNESINVELTISNTSLKTNIDLAEIEEYFEIEKQIRRSSHTIINGKTSKSDILQLQLKPLKPGTITFPILSANTIDGEVKSKAFKIEVLDEIGTSENAKELAKITAEISTNKLYQGEYAILKLKVFIFSDIYNAQLSIPESKTAKIEKIYSIPTITKSIDGKKTQISEIIYKITPILYKDISLEPVILTGQIQKKFKEKNDFFNQNRFFFSNNLNQYEDVTIASNKIPIIKVLDLGIANLASNKFTKEQKISNVQSEINNPIDLSIVLTADNNSADMLPEIELPNNNYVEFYKENSLTNEKYDPITNKITATKTQNFTIIPKQQGNSYIDQVDIKWINKKTNKIENLKLDRIKLIIKDPNKTLSQDAVKPETKSEDTKLENTIVVKETKNYNLIIYLILIILILFFYSLWLTLKITNLTKLHFIKRPNKKIFLLTRTETFDDLKDFIFDFFNKHFEKDFENFSEIISLIQKLDLNDENKKALELAISKIELSLYSKQKYQFDLVKDELKNEIKTIDKAAQKFKKQKNN